MSITRSDKTRTRGAIVMVSLALTWSVWLVDGAASAEPPAPRFQRWLRAGEVLGGMEMLAGSEVEFHDAAMSKVKTAMLARATRIDGIVFRARTVVELRPDGKLLRGTPQADVTVSGVCCRQGRPLRLAASGDLQAAELCADLVIGGVPLRGGTAVELHPAARLRSGTLARDHRLGALLLAGGSHIEVFADGKLRSGKLARDVRLAGVVCRAGGTVKLDEEGRLRSAVLAGSVKRGSVLIPKRSRIELDEGGRIRRAETGGVTTAVGLRLGAGSVLQFEDGGELARVSPDRDVTFKGIQFKGGSELRVECCDLPGPVNRRFELVFMNRRLWAATLASEQKLGGLWLQRGSTVSFHPDGSLDSAVLGREQIVDGRRMPAGHTLHLSTGTRPALPGSAE